MKVATLIMILDLEPKYDSSHVKALKMMDKPGIYDWRSINE